MDQKRDFRLKVLVIGDVGTGKRTLLNQYVHHTRYLWSRTPYTDSHLKLITIDENTRILLQLFDMRRDYQQSRHILRQFYREALGCFILFDVTRGSTFEAVTRWKTELDNEVRLPDGNPVPCVLLANKCDLAKEGLVNDAQQMDEFCKEKGFAQWFEVSATEDVNVETSMRFLINKILKLPEEFLPDRTKGTINRESFALTVRPVSKTNSGSSCYGGSSSS